MYFPFVILAIAAFAVSAKADYFQNQYSQTRNGQSNAYNQQQRSYSNNPTGRPISTLATTQATLNPQNYFERQSNPFPNGPPPTPSETPQFTQTSQSEIREPLPVTILYHDSKEITFVSSNQTANPINITRWENATHRHPIQFSPEFSPSKHVLLRGSYVYERTLPSLGFIQTVLESYKNHHSIVIRPDDIWTAILCQFSLYVNAHSEELRSQFVTHNGTRNLVLELDVLDSSTNLSANQWRRVLSMMKNKLRNEIRRPDWILNNFTTTEERDIIVSSVAMMSIMQKYFNYEIRILCGIPEITILGTQEDWLTILAKLRELGGYGEDASKWATMMTPVIQQFIYAKGPQPHIDMEFWGDIAKVQTTEMCPGKMEQTIDGWITVFGVFDPKGKWRGDRQPGWKWPRIQTKHLASGVVAVPISISGHGRVTNGTVFAGHMGHRYSPDRTTLQPLTGWAVARNI